MHALHTLMRLSLRPAGENRRSHDKMAQQCLLMWTHTVMWVAAATTSGITAPSLPTHDFLDLVLTVGHEASLKASWKKNQNKTAISSYIPQGF